MKIGTGQSRDPNNAGKERKAAGAQPLLGDRLYIVPLLQQWVPSETIVPYGYILAASDVGTL